MSNNFATADGLESIATIADRLFLRVRSRARRTHKLCTECKCRPALFRRHGGRPKFDRRHRLCRQCWRTYRDRVFAALLAEYQQPFCEEGSASGGQPAEHSSKGTGLQPSSFSYRAAAL